MARCAIHRGLIAVALAAAPSAEEAPSLELLLHLAEYGDAGGETIDPIAADAMLEHEPPAQAPRGPGDPRVPAARRTSPHDPDAAEQHDESR